MVQTQYTASLAATQEDLFAHAHLALQGHADAQRKQMTNAVWRVRAAKCRS